MREVGGSVFSAVNSTRSRLKRITERSGDAMPIAATEVGRWLLRAGPHGFQILRAAPMQEIGNRIGLCRWSSHVDGIAAPGTGRRWLTCCYPADLLYSVGTS